MVQLGPQLSFPVSSVRQARLYRKDLGDLAGLKDSIMQRGLVCPLVIAPDGLLISGARRLAAVTELGWDSVPVYVAGGVSDELHARLAIAAGLLHTKSLTTVEAAALFRELRELLIEERTRAREEARKQTGRSLGEGKVGDSPTSLGRIRTLAARAITETDSGQRFERVCHVQNVADDEGAPGEVRACAREALRQIEQTEQVNGPWLKVRRAETAAQLRDLTNNPDAPPDLRKKATRFSHALRTEDDPVQLASLITAAAAICDSASSARLDAAVRAAEAEVRRVRLVITGTIRSVRHLHVTGMGPHLSGQDVSDAEQAARLVSNLAAAIRHEIAHEQQVT